MAKTPENIPETTDKKERLDPRWRRAVKRAMALSAILTIAASAGATIEANREAAHEPTTDTTELTDHSLRIHDSEPGYEGEVAAGWNDIIPGEDGSLRLPSLEKVEDYSQTTSETVIGTQENPPVRTAEETRIYTEKVQNMIWAEQFGIHNPGEIQPRGPDAIQAAVDRVKSSLEEGKEIVSIKILGTASDESDVRVGDHNPGLGVHDKKNENLGAMREKAVARWFEKKLEQEIGKDQAKTIEDVITLQGGKEIIDPQLNQDVEQMADSLGMETDDMVMSFNRGEDLPDQAEDVLEGYRDDRYVSIQIEVADNTEAEIPSGSIVVETVKTTQHTKVIYVLVPIPVPPIPGRRKTTTPPTVTTPPKQKWGIPTSDPKLPGYSGSAPVRIKQPDTSNAHFGKGSGGRVQASRGTSHRGQRR